MVVVVVDGGGGSVVVDGPDSVVVVVLVVLVVNDVVVGHCDLLHRSGSTTMSRPWLPVAVFPAPSTSATSSKGELRSIRRPAPPLSFAVARTSVRSSDDE